MLWSKKKKKQLTDLNDRLTTNSKQLAEDHHDLMELKVENQVLTERIQALEAKMQLLENNQGHLRDVLRLGLGNPDIPFSNPKLASNQDGVLTPIVPLVGGPYLGHTCVNKDGQPSTTATCVECNKDA